MTVDLLGRQAGQALREQTSDLDVEAPLEQALDRRRRRHRRPGLRAVAGLGLAVAAVLLLVVWLSASGVVGSRESVPPADPADEVVGNQLSVPAQFTVPDDWEVVQDTGVVELAPSDGSDRSIVAVGQPVRVFEPPRYRPTSLGEDLVVWVTTRSDLEISEKFGLDGPNFAWTGTQMVIGLRPGVDSAPLVALPGRERMSITSNDQTYRWDVIYLTDSPPLLVASSSATADDPLLQQARNELLQSLKVNSSN